MQQFTVPQFIDVEDKIIGPITTRQFLIMLVAGLICAVFYKVFYFNTFIITSLIVLGIFGIVAFLKINGRPFHFFVLNFIQTLKRHKLRIWQKEIISVTEKEGEGDGGLEKMTAVEPRRKYTKSRLNELSLIVDTQGAYKGEEGEGEVLVDEINGSQVKDLEIA